MNLSLSRRGLIGLGIGTGVAAASGCSTATRPNAPSSTSPSAGATVTGGGGKKAFNLQVMAKQDEFDAAELERFLADKDYDVTLIEPDPTTLNAMLAANNPPDVVRDAGANVTPYLVHKGLAAELDDYIANSSLINTDDLQPINDVWRFDGSVQGAGPRYGIIKDFSLDSQFWMLSDVAEQAGLTLPTPDKPWTFDELLENSKAMTSRSGNRTSMYGLFTTAPSVETFQVMLAESGGSMFGPDLDTVDLTSPEAQAIIQWFIDAALAKTGYSLLDPNPDGWDWPAVSAGRGASMLAGYWIVGQLAADEEGEPFRERLRMLPSPMMGSQRAAATFAGVGMWIPNKSQHKDEAFNFLEWHCAGEPAQTRAKLGWGIPPLKSLESALPSEMPYQLDALEAHRAEAEHAKILTFSPFAQPAAINAVLQQEFVGIAQGSAKAADYAAAVTPKINQLLTEGKG